MFVRACPGSVVNKLLSLLNLKIKIVRALSSSNSQLRLATSCINKFTRHILIDSLARVNQSVNFLDRSRKE